jgi:hypothetical protein
MIGRLCALRSRVLVHIAAIRNRSAGPASSWNLALAPFTFYIDSYWITCRKCFIKRLVQKVVNMHPCSWRHLAQFLPDKHDLRALLLQLADLHDIYALAGNKEGPIRKIEDRGATRLCDRPNGVEQRALRLDAGGIELRFGVEPSLVRVWRSQGIRRLCLLLQSPSELIDILRLDWRRRISPGVADIGQHVRDLRIIEIPTKGGHGGRGRRS